MRESHDCLTSVGGVVAIYIKRVVNTVAKIQVIVSQPDNMFDFAKGVQFDQPILTQPNSVSSFSWRAIIMLLLVRMPDTMITLPVTKKQVLKNLLDLTVNACFRKIFAHSACPW